VRKELALQKIRTHLPVRYQPADGGIRLEGVWAQIDPASGRATAVEAIRRSLDGEA
jgi:calcineurin-like phosphoesterase